MSIHIYTDGKFLDISNVDFLGKKENDCTVTKKGGTVTLERCYPGRGNIYYRLDSGGIFISSTLSVLLALEKVTLDKRSLIEYLYHDFPRDGRTLYKNIAKVKCDQRVNLEVGKTNDFKIKYEDIDTFEQNRSDEGNRKLINIVSESIVEQYNKEKKIVSLLSSGLDSTLIFSLACRMGVPVENAITYSSPYGYNEVEAATKTAKLYGVNIEIVEGKDLKVVEQAYLSNAIWGQPFGHASSSALIEMMDKFTVGLQVLTGDGGGEPFAGNGTKYRINRIIKKLSSLYEEGNWSLTLDNSEVGRKFNYLVESYLAKNDFEAFFAQTPVTRKELKYLFPDIEVPFKHNLYKESDFRLFEGDSMDIFARLVPYWWGCEGVYAKTYKVLEYRNSTGISPLTSPEYFTSLAKLPVEKKKLGKKSIYKQEFGNIIPEHIYSVPKLGLRPNLRSKLIDESSEIFEFVKNSNIDSSLGVDLKVFEQMLSQHKNKIVYRTNLLWKIVCLAELSRSSNCSVG